MGVLGHGIYVEYALYLFDFGGEAISISRGVFFQAARHHGFGTDLQNV